MKHIVISTGEASGEMLPVIFAEAYCEGFTKPRPAFLEKL